MVDDHGKANDHWGDDSDKASGLDPCWDGVLVNAEQPCNFLDAVVAGRRGTWVRKRSLGIFNPCATAADLRSWRGLLPSRQPLI
jgi:hypothetical protein